MFQLYACRSGVTIDETAVCDEASRVAFVSADSVDDAHVLKEQRVAG